jgi:DNA-directed RNA polymerase specialized sigma24 family protein
VKTGRLTTRFLGGPALRFQPDGRLVSLMRDGYESAFEEIFRRYGAALRGYAASIVTAQRADDVTQEAFTKAYLALRGSDKEIQLPPWLSGSSATRR